MMVADWGTTLMHHAPELRGEQRIAPAIAYGASAPQAAAPRSRWGRKTRQRDRVAHVSHRPRFPPPGMVVLERAAGDPTNTGPCLQPMGPIRMSRRGEPKTSKIGW